MNKILTNTRISSLSRLNRLLKGDAYCDSRFFIIVDENSYSHCLPTLISSVSALENSEFFEVPVGEEAKSLEIAAQLWQSLIESAADRNSVIINLGGGCVSDLGGFVAAGYKRGIRYINVPTTLIGMIDASIGGKTAVNMIDTKNQIGFFHQPEAVCIFPDFLDTLADEELVSGFFEIIKTLIISDTEAIKKILSSTDFTEGLPLEHIKLLISQCVDFKNNVVNADPKERSIRKILNFGHTFGHAIESYDIGNPLQHGIAVGIGMLCELYLSVNKLGMSKKVLDDYSKLLRCYVTVPKFTLRDAEAILGFMRRDKKNADGQIMCVLLQDTGVPVIDVPIDENEVRDTLLKAAKL